MGASLNVAADDGANRPRLSAPLPLCVMAGLLLAAAGADGKVHVWQVSKRQQLTTLQASKKGVRGIAFSPDGRLLASGSEDGVVRLWEWKTGKSVGRLRAAGGRIFALAFTPDS